MVIIRPEFLDSNSDTYIHGLTIIDAFQYLILLGVFVFFLWPRLFTLIKRFKNWKHIIIGLGFGGLVIGMTIVYNLIITQFIELPTNANEELQPVPYVFLLSPCSKQVCPNNAACWSPATPQIETFLSKYVALPKL